MPENNIGSMNILTGVPQRVGAPVSDIVKINSQLTQQYWKNQEQNQQINSALKNMPTIADSVDKQHIADASSKVNEIFKSTIDTGNWENAIQSVMDASNYIVNNEALKSIQTNYALLQKANTDLEKRYEKEPVLRQYADVFKARTLKAYIENGGSIDTNGKSQQIKIFTPTTNMDLTEDIKRVDDSVSKMKAIKQTAFTNQQYVTQADVDKLDDPDVKAVFQGMLKSEDKVSVESLTVDRLRAAAIKELEANPLTKAKILEIAQADHFKQTGSDTITANELKSYLKSKGNDFEKKMALNLSEDYLQDLEILRKHSSNNKEFREGLKKLNNNPYYYEQGQNKFAELNSNNLSTIYYNIVSGDMMNTLISTVDKYTYSSTDLDRKYFENKISDALLKQIQDTKEKGFIAQNEVASSVLDFSLSSINSKSDVYQNLKKLESQVNAYGNNVPDNIKMAYENAKSAYKGTLKAISDNFISLPKEEQSKLLIKVANSGDGLFGLDLRKSPYLYNIFMDSSGKNPKAFDNSNNKLNFNKTVDNMKYDHPTAIKQNLKSIISHNIDLKTLLTQDNRSAILGAIPKNAIPYYNKYRNEIYSELSDVLDKARLELGTRTKETKLDLHGTLISPWTEYNYTGKHTPEFMNWEKAVNSAFAAGSLKDAMTNTIIDPKTKHKIDGNENGTMLSDNKDDLTDTEIVPVNSNGTYTGKGQLVKITKPIYIPDPHNPGKVIKSNSRQTFYAVYDGNTSLTNGTMISNMNTLSKYSKPDNPMYSTAIETSKSILNNIASSTLADKNGRQLVDHINELLISQHNTPFGKDRKNIIIGSENGNDIHMDISREGDKYNVIIDKGNYYVTYHPQDIRTVLSLAGFINNMQSINPALREQIMNNFNTETFKKN